ncbi:MAG: helix-turn-helix domain-containing protein [Patescibacteria group bacterium]
MQEATERLLELGLSEKEAEVYLAMLELGPSIVQAIAKKAQVNRTTTYVLLESLKQRGLISSFLKDNKVFFAAESPLRLEDLLSREEQRIRSTKRHFEKAMPYFTALYNSMDGKPKVRFFEGDEGITAARDFLSRYRGEYLSFTAIDEGTEYISKVNAPQRMKMAKRMHGRYIYALKPGCHMPPTDLTTWDVRELPYKKFPFTGEINIISDVVGAYVVKGGPMAFVVESREMADLFRVLFFTAWAVAKPVDKKTLIRSNQGL